jgi:hypothetical protein
MRLQVGSRKLNEQVELLLAIRALLAYVSADLASGAKHENSLVNLLRT